MQIQKSQASQAQTVFDQAFLPGRPPRSSEYKNGVLDCLKARLDGAKHLRCPYPVGTAQADAYLSGVDEGVALSLNGKVNPDFDGLVSATF